MRSLVQTSLLLSVVYLAAAPAVQTQQPTPTAVPEEEPFVEPVELHHAPAGEAPFAAPVNAATGQWVTLTTVMPINPVHVAQMYDGKVLVITGSGNDPGERMLMAGVWDPVTRTIATFRLNWDMFCNGMVILPDGRPFVLGGTLAYDPFKGEPRTAAYQPLGGGFADLPRMLGGRWYPTGTVLGDGSVMVISGLNDTDGRVNRSVQTYKPATNTWRNAGTVFSGVPLFPRQHLLPTGRVFVSGANADTKLWNPATFAWTNGPRTIFGQARDYGTSVLLPLLPANNFRPKVFIAGGGPRGANVTSTTEVIDLSAGTLRWQAGPNMQAPRIQLNATILPNGKVLVSGGSKTDESVANAVLPAELYDPATNTFASAGAMAFPRLYHSNTLLLPDATVLAVGSNPKRRDYEHRIEIYSPPYLFNAGGGAATRPEITGVSPAAFSYGAKFTVQTPTAASIRSVVLVRPGAVTHAFDMEQRLVGLNFTTGAGALNVTAPADGNLAPPGYYMLFILNSAGVPSLARFVQLR
ncbi:MAG TPA: galactose oxidase-like domain-containing protein [Thermoanaerobaculia bacterium]|nr:galactose oxidase-like domain-containing protein [Thermoanaerobaculia bacterium]